MVAWTFPGVQLLSSWRCECILTLFAKWRGKEGKVYRGKWCILGMCSSDSCQGVYFFSKLRKWNEIGQQNAEKKKRTVNKFILEKAQAESWLQLLSFLLSSNFCIFWYPILGKSSFKEEHRLTRSATDGHMVTWITNTKKLCEVQSSYKHCGFMISQICGTTKLNGNLEAYLNYTGSGRLL